MSATNPSLVVARAVCEVVEVVDMVAVVEVVEIVPDRSSPFAKKVHVYIVWCMKWRQWTQWGHRQDTLKSLHVFLEAESGDFSDGDYTDAYLRICKPGVSYKEPSIGRVVTSERSRGKGIGVKLMKKGIKVCESLWPKQGVRISAQKYLEKFYTDLGFEVCSEPYLEDDIPHIQMFRK